MLSLSTMKGVFHYLIFAGLLLLTACYTPRTESAAHQFSIPQPSAMLDRAAQIDFLRYHYWDNFNFADTVALQRADTAEMERHFSQYVALLSTAPRDRAPMDSLMKRAATSRLALDYFSMLAARVLHDPNAALRSSELYIPVLEAQLQAPYYDEYDRLVTTHDLQVARQNRLGEPANDFRFLTRTGENRSLYELQSDYTLIFFSNPDCSMCRMLKELLLHSALIVERISEGRLTMLVINLDEEPSARKSEELPHGWIEGHDLNGSIQSDQLYDLRAIPSIYLLDREKRVLVKDSTDPREVEEALR